MRHIVLLIFLFTASALVAQQPAASGTDSLRIPSEPGLDTLPKERLRIAGFFSRDYPNPTKAMVFSFILPGSGQAYNKKWWKIPIVYGVFAGLTWLELQNIDYYRNFRDNYKYAVDGDPATNPVEYPYNAMDATRLKYYRDSAQKTLEQSSLVLALAYFLTATDAFVDAHLKSFDVGEDLSLRLRPRPQVMPGGGISYGMGISLQLGRNTAAKP